MIFPSVTQDQFNDGVAAPALQFTVIPGTKRYQNSHQ
jgi:hypothetical protein